MVHGVLCAGSGSYRPLDSNQRCSTVTWSFSSLSRWFWVLALPSLSLTTLSILPIHSPSPHLSLHPFRTHPLLPLFHSVRSLVLSHSFILIPRFLTRPSPHTLFRLLPSARTESQYPSHVLRTPAIIFAVLLTPTYRFGKGMMPKAYRLSREAMTVTVEKYAAAAD
ncbi:hypothetical protein DFH08DRAFT_867777 [Mycena albidolilacea]|uniref:Uncharacterized protein n=1 Tax=Mycena albidolilacea TaxID=1033008 RepID=A0AAD7A252_9AGAR|nr:hypothetical protein DFH08DRAFT_867777 [Mycena albidolilacea]